MSQENQALTLPWNNLSEKLRLDISREFFLQQFAWQPVQKDEASLGLLGQIAAHEFFIMRTKNTNPDTWCKSWENVWCSLKNDEREYVAAAFMEKLVSPDGERLDSEGSTFSVDISFASKDPVFVSALNRVLTDISLLNDPWRHWKDVSNHHLGRLTSIVFDKMLPDKQKSLAHQHPGLGSSYAWVLSGSSFKDIIDPSEYKWDDVGKSMSSFCDELSGKKEIKGWYAQALPIIDKLFMYNGNLVDENFSSWEPWWYMRGLVGWSAESKQQITAASSGSHGKSDISNKIMGISMSVFDRALDLLPQKSGFLKKLTPLPLSGVSNFLKDDTNRATQSWMMIAACRDHPEAFMSFEGLDARIHSTFSGRQFWDGLRNGDVVCGAVIPFFHPSPRVQLAVAKDACLSATVAQWFEDQNGNFSTSRHMIKNENGQSFHDNFFAAWGAFREARLLSQINVLPNANQRLKI